MAFDAARLIREASGRLGAVWHGGSLQPLLATATVLVLALTLGGDTLAPPGPPGPKWDKAQLEELRQRAEHAPDEGLPKPQTQAFRAALASGRNRRINAEATALALRLAQSQLTGAAPASERAEWYIADPDSKRALAPELAAALDQGRFGSWFDSLAPQHPAYAALRAALAVETDPARRTQIARNMERWRWLPQSLGDDFLFANAAGFEVALWRRGRPTRTWVAISGRAKTPTPSVAAMATAINFNPWWEVPPSIAKEGGMTARRGYVAEGNRFRQKPGPGNSLGRMKVVMYNPHNIYLHDTPAKGLFGARERAFSHGCMRVSDALGLAQVLLGSSKSKAQIDKILEEEDKSVVVPLPRSLPVYVAYFTVDTNVNGQVRFHRDIYGRDAKIASISLPETQRLAVR